MSTLTMCLKGLYLDYHTYKSVYKKIVFNCSCISARLAISIKPILHCFHFFCSEVLNEVTLIALYTAVIKYYHVLCSLKCFRVD